jgi:hypothetical protein
MRLPQCSATDRKNRLEQKILEEISSQCAPV